MIEYTNMDAVFDGDNKLRLTLRREWKPGPSALVAMLNPSNGSVTRDDPTLRRLTEIMDGLGFGGYTVVNWSPFISSDPKAMLEFMHRVYGAQQHGRFTRYAMKKNIETVARVASALDTTIAAWGNDFPASMSAGDALSAYTAQFLTTIMREGQCDLMCFGVTKHGAPKHPLARGAHRIKPTVKLMPWIGRHT